MGWIMGLVKAPISEKASARLTKMPGMHAVGGVSGLYLYVSKGNACSWIYRYTFNGRRRDLGLGSRNDFTLAEARERAREQRKLLLQGIDPIIAKRKHRDQLKTKNALRRTFMNCVEGYIDAHGDEWRNDKHRQQWQSSLEIHAKLINDMDVAVIDTPLVLRVLEPIWREKTETASRLRGRIENVLSWATVRGFRQGDNPARWKGHLDQLLPSPSKVSAVQHHAALPYKEIGTFMAQLRTHQGIGARALEFAILTAARSGEVRGARWEEINLADRIWTVPASRMKAKKDHVVPLSDDVVEVIKKMKKLRMDDKSSSFVFPGAKEGKPLSDMSLTKPLRTMGRADLTAHGFRSTFRDWCAELTGYPSELAEMALAHTIKNKVEAAYRRGDLLEKRALLMADWARYCAKPMPAAAEVLPLKGRKQK